MTRMYIALLSRTYYKNMQNSSSAPEGVAWGKKYHAHVRPKVNIQVNK